MLSAAVIQGRRQFLVQQLLAISVVSDTPGVDEFQDNPEKMLAVELPFMWGWNYAYAKAAGKWPTSPSMRTSAQMIKYLMDHHEFDFEEARREASTLDKLWNEADPLFEAISKHGEESFSNPNSPYLGHIISVLLEQNLSLRDTAT